MGRKYEILRDDSINYQRRTLYRIRALKSFGVVKAGDLGGYIEKESNLSQKGDCWVFDNAKVFGDAIVCDDATIHDNAEIYGNATISGKGSVMNYAKVFGHAHVLENAYIMDNAKIFGRAQIKGEAFVTGNAQIYDNAIVCDRALVYGGEVFGNACIEYFAVVKDNACIYGNACIGYGVLDCDIKSDLRKLIACSLNVYPNPVTNTYIFYKRVNKIRDGIYRSLYDENFIYKDGEIIEVKKYDTDFLKSCSSGLHVSTPFYCRKDGNALIAVEVHLDDIITCMDGVIRCRRLKVLGEVKEEEKK